MFQISLCAFLNIIFVIVLTVIPYTIMIFCKIKISRHLKLHHHCLPTASRTIQTDLNRILTAQAIISIFFVFLPETIHFLGLFINVDFVFPSFICGILYSWIPAGNAICVLFFVTAYRKRLKQLFRSKTQFHNFVSISATVTTGH